VLYPSSFYPSSSLAARCCSVLLLGVCVAQALSPSDRKPHD